MSKGKLFIPRESMYALGETLIRESKSIEKLDPNLLELTKAWEVNIGIKTLNQLTIDDDREKDDSDLIRWTIKLLNEVINFKTEKR